jgi:hypothetical protein
MAFVLPVDQGYVLNPSLWKDFSHLARFLKFLKANLQVKARLSSAQESAGQVTIIPVRQCLPV